MSELPPGIPQERVRSTCDGFSVPDDRRAPVDRDGPVGRESIGAPTEREGGPVMRRVIGAAPVSRPVKTETSHEYPATGEGGIGLIVALPAFAIGCLVGLLLR
jgi:hypothetical protein